jgi:hypothetical protein
LACALTLRMAFAMTLRIAPGFAKLDPPLHK